jgi:hypothetical protein
MAMVKNKTNEEREIDFGQGRIHLHPGELITIDDEVFRYRTFDDTNFEVRGKPDFAAKTIEELRVEEEKAAAENPPPEQAGILAGFELPDPKATDKALQESWDSLVDRPAPKKPAAPKSEKENV